MLSKFKIGDIVVFKGEPQPIMTVTAIYYGPNSQDGHNNANYYECDCADCGAHQYAEDTLEFYNSAQTNM